MRLLVAEFNEIDAGLIDRGIARGELPAFAAFRRSAECYVTDACDEFLEPWVQWVTVHTGVPLSEHGAVQLGQADSVPQPFIWETLAAAGYGSWVCGTMNARETAALAGRVLPDYWTLPEPRSPFLPFSRFVNACVSRHADRRHRLPLRLAFQFLAFMARHGLRAATLMNAVRHFSSAVVTGTPWRLVFVLEDCQLDLFFHEFARLKPQLGVFFVNSVAHLQHNYWREMEPGQFDAPASPARRRHRHAIAEGYRHLDSLLARLLAAVGDDTTILLCSALGQQPYRPQAGRGAFVYRVRDIERTVRTLALPLPRRTLRTMAGSFSLEYDDPGAAADAVRRLRAVMVGGTQLFHASVRDGVTVLVEVALTNAETDEQPLIVEGRMKPLRLGELLEVGHHKSGEHHPHGLLWVRGKYPRLTPAGGIAAEGWRPGAAVPSGPSGAEASAEAAGTAEAAEAAAAVKAAKAAEAAEAAEAAAAVKAAKAAEAAEAAGTVKAAKAADTPVPLTAIAPSIERFFGLARP